MKARVKATGEIVDVNQCAILYEDGKRELMQGKELEEVQGAPDYWEKLKHQYAGMAMQGILANPEMMSLSDIDVAATAIRIANITISKLKEESQCEK